MYFHMIYINIDILICECININIIYDIKTSEGFTTSNAACTPEVGGLEPLKHLLFKAPRN